MPIATIAPAESEIPVRANAAGILSDIVIDDLGLRIRGTIVLDLGDTIALCPEEPSALGRQSPVSK